MEPLAKFRVEMKGVGRTRASLNGLIKATRIKETCFFVSRRSASITAEASLVAVLQVTPLLTSNRKQESFSDQKYHTVDRFNTLGSKMKETVSLLAFPAK